MGPITALAVIENGVGWVYAHLGQNGEALTCCQRALELHREIGYRAGEADTLDSLGYIHNQVKDHRQAAECYAQAAEIYHEIGDRFHRAGSQIGLGDALLYVRKQAAARKTWEQALTCLLYTSRCV